MARLDSRMWIEQYRHSDYMAQHLRDMTVGYTVLNLCSGKSDFGIVRIDIDKSLKEPTSYADMFHALKSFRNNQFDFVYVDPPFERDGINFYNPRSKYIVEKAKELGYKDEFGRLVYDWQKQCFDIAKICLITKRDRSNVNLPALYTEYHKLWDSRPSTVDIRFDWKYHPR